MNCLMDFIQIEGCSAPQGAGASGLFINKDLPISLKQIDAVADSEQLTFLEVWKEVQQRGIKKFVNRVKAGYKELFGICFIEEDWFCENKQQLAHALLYYLGMELMTERLYSDRINRYTTIDRSKAKEQREEFQGEFYIQLKDALELIGHAKDKRADGDIANYREVLP